MKITLLNTYDTGGGAAVACRRLFHAIHQPPAVQSKLLVTKGTIHDDRIYHLEKNWMQKQMGWARIGFERMSFLRHHNKSINPFYFSPANTGHDLSQHPAIQWADILHLHWINLGMLSINGLKKLQSLGKPIVWTLHDMWAFTGGCHYSHDCENYLTGCGQCSTFLKHPKANDLSKKLNDKKEFFKYFHFVTCSKWLKDEALKSHLLKGADVRSIPNPIDTQLFKPGDKAKQRTSLGLRTDKKYILFGAANLADKRKGFQYMLDTLRILGSRVHDHNIELVVFGKSDASLMPDTMKVNLLGSINSMEKMAQVYGACDVFVIPSLQDNLPNTIMESLSCGTPVAGFDTGGIPEMVDHLKNGYIAAYKDADDLAAGILNVLENQLTYAQAAREKVLKNYTETVVSQQYIDLYHSLLNESIA